PMPLPFCRSNLSSAACAGLGAFLLAAALPACASTGAASQSTTAQASEPANRTANPSAAGVPIDHAAWRELGLAWDWAGFPVVSEGGFISDFALTEDRLFIQESASIVSALDATTGRLDWTVEVAGPLTRFVGMVPDGTRLLVPSESELYEFASSTGNLMSRQKLTRVVNTRPAVVGSLAIFGTASGELIAHDRDLGLTRWRYALSGPIKSEPIVLDGTIIGAVSDDGDVIALDASNAAAVGRTRIAGGVGAPITTDTFHLFVASLDQSVYAITSFGGERVWRVRTEDPIRMPGILADNLYIFSTPGRGVVGVEPFSGDLVWEIKDLGETAPVGMLGGELLTWNGRTATLIDAERGEVVAQADLPGIRSITIGDNDTVYAITDANTVLRFRQR
ncbi:MAG: PQQ-binding-like beta-propeller repeat protein, partial [Planctomycetota bacterium]